MGRPTLGPSIKPATLTCDHCGRTVETRINLDDPDNWPQHRCARTREIEPFTRGEPLNISLARDYRHPDHAHNERVAALLAR